MYGLQQTDFELSNDEKGQLIQYCEPLSKNQKVSLMDIKRRISDPLSQWMIMMLWTCLHSSLSISQGILEVWKCTQPFWKWNQPNLSPFPCPVNLLFELVLFESFGTLPSCLPLYISFTKAFHQDENNENHRVHQTQIVKNSSIPQQNTKKRNLDMNIGLHG